MALGTALPTRVLTSRQVEALNMLDANAPAYVSTEALVEWLFQEAGEPVAHPSQACRATMKGLVARKLVVEKRHGEGKGARYTYRITAAGRKAFARA